MEIADESADRDHFEEVKEPEFAQLVNTSADNDDEQVPLDTMASENEPLETFDNEARQNVTGAVDMRAIRLAALRRQSNKNQEE